ncbi:PHD finger protein 12-like [Osmerus eperlanus]|uniref:PHD finger protein 12-like n=1 Tax=Osmerus eperlanus TaxID=29151 RepID=UPI002E15F0F7
MWDKMETPTIVYDLDTSGGLMEQIQTLLSPPKSMDGQNTSRKSERETRKSGRATNHNTCDSCREGGDLLCCDHCPAAFHPQCCNPPLSEENLPPGDWICHRCNVRSKKRDQKAEQTNGLLERPNSKRSSSPALELNHGPGPLHLDGLTTEAGAAGPVLRMAAVAQVRLLERRCSSRTNSRPGTPTSNASSTPTPSEEQNEVVEDMAETEEEAHGSEPEGLTPSTPTPRLLKRPFQLLIAAAMERNPTQFQLPNEFTCSSALPGSSKRRKREELIEKVFKKPQPESDPNGPIPLPVKVCFNCTRSCRMAPLIQCDYCPLLFHMECLDPPLSAMPAGSWMCPNHMEHLVLNQRNPNLTNRCQLFDQFQDRMSQHAVKVDFLRRVHRQNPPNHQHRKKTIKVPDGIKSQYNSPPVLAPRGVRNGELVCNGNPKQDNPTQHFTSEVEQQEWLQDVIALQCSIMRHLSSEQKLSLSDWEHTEKADLKPCLGTGEQSSLPPPARTACFKPCSTLGHPQGASELNSPMEEGHCQNYYRKPNGPLAEQSLAKGCRSVTGDSVADSSSQAELHNRLKPSQTPPSSTHSPSQGLSNHIGDVAVKMESTNRLGSCALRDWTTSLTIRPDIGQIDQTQIRGLGQIIHVERPSFDGAPIFTPPRAVSDVSASKLVTFSPSPGSTPGIKTSPEVVVSPPPSSLLPSITDLSGRMMTAIEFEMGKLDEELVKLLALQRIQQLFPPKAPPTLPSSLAAPAPTTVALKPQTPPEEPQKKEVQARAMFYPLMGKGGAVSMCYRALYIGSGADMDVCLTNYGQCNYVSGKHACIFYDENTKHYELLNYSEHGTTVDNVLYSCDFSEKPPPSPASSPVAKVPGVVRRCKVKEQEERSGALVGLMPAGGVMSSQPQGGSRLSCNCKASSSSLIGGSGAGWEGTALLHHGSYIKLGCLQFVFSIAELASKLPKEETVNKATGTDSTTPDQEGADKTTLSHKVPVQSANPIP